MVKMKFLRLDKGWSLNVLAVHASMQPGEISKIKRGLLVPYESQRVKLAEALGVAPERLLEEVSAEALVRHVAGVRATSRRQLCREHAARREEAP